MFRCCRIVIGYVNGTVIVARSTVCVGRCAIMAFGAECPGERHVGVMRSSCRSGTGAGESTAIFMAGCAAGGCTPDRRYDRTGSVGIVMAGCGRAGTGIAGVDCMLGYCSRIAVGYVNITV